MFFEVNTLCFTDQERGRNYLVNYKMKVVLLPGTKSLIALAHLPSPRRGINRLSWLFSPYYDKIANNRLCTCTYSRRVLFP